MNVGFVVDSLAVFYATFVIACSFAWWKGGMPERQGVILLLAMLVLQLLGRMVLPEIYLTVDPVACLVDLFGFAGFAWIGYHAPRYWPLWAAALQLLSLAGHFARRVEHEIEPLVYAIMKSAPTYLIFLALILGTLAHWRRAHRAPSRASSAR